MDIDKSVHRAPQGLPEDEDLVVEIAAEAPMTELEDGSMEVIIGPVEEVATDALPHDENLAEHLDPDYLNKLAGDLLSDIEDDEMTRSDWETTYKDGLELLGLKIEERDDPWEGACGVVHPLLSEAVVRFQSELIMETFPAQGPVKTKILGHPSREKEEAAARVKEDMNIELTDRMTEFRLEHERMLWNLPIAGSALKKTYYDPSLGRQVSMFVSADDFIVAYGASDLASCPRYTHRMKKFPNDLKRLQAAKFYRDVELSDPVAAQSEVGAKQDELQGTTPSHVNTQHTIYEVHVDLKLDGYDDDAEFDRPYIVTIEKDSATVLAIRRNWKEGDPKYKKELHFTHYQYITGFGFYGFGLIHLIGGFAKGATSILRQLVDAGTLSNLPGGLKTRGMRVKGDDSPIGPGEWRDVDVPSGTLKENLLPLPYKEPSVVLADLLNTIVEEGRKLAAVAEMKVADFNENSPVGTTMALLERTLKVMSAVQARIYESMKHEFRLIKSLIEQYGSDTYEYEPVTGDQSMKGSDYASVEVLPVADPNAATMSQRIVQWQAVMQLAQMAPQIYDMPELHAQMLDILGVRNVDKLIPGRKDNLKPTDPVTENMHILMGQPVKAHFTQDHNSHLAVHQAMMSDPMMQAQMGQNPMAQQMQGAMMAHIMEHTAFAYRQQIEQHLGTQLPHPDEDLPPEVEVQVSGVLAAAAQKLLASNQNQAQQMQAQQQAQDPVHQQHMAEVKVKEMEVQRKAMRDQEEMKQKWAELELRAQELQVEAQKEGIKLSQEAAMKQAEHEMKLREGEQKMQMEREKHELTREKHDMDLQAEGTRMAHEMMNRQEDRVDRAEERQFNAMEKDKDRQFNASEKDKDRVLNAIDKDENRNLQREAADKAAKSKDKSDSKPKKDK